MAASYRGGYSTDAVLEALLLDSTIVRAHQTMLPAPKKRRCASDWPLAQKLACQIHMAVDALGNPLRWHLTGGEVHSITQAPALIAGVNAQQVIADKGYDSDAFVAYIAATGAQAVIPPRKKRREARPYDRVAYRERHLIECFFSRLKQFRQIATRYEKLARNFLSMLNLAAAYIWLV